MQAYPDFGSVKDNGFFHSCSRSNDHPRTHVDIWTKLPMKEGGGGEGGRD